ncbi:hypothetical protein IV38_GL002018 [Lactobacillus selangorensis]|uniref:UPF0316 protein IV38_GL002018 n=1 Tax=Lactobacillus selangorensis TaxID=81857 RepID=A0A0R2FZ74_9LACO|nr:DUF2179 domain-containing protein [Lactobacillus selangorensis]KRN27563.1 hypothetical protein IV38_GL002018 [Lactobacillus selangorensis]KRN30164.1 hypothetical protein IV40_GL002010 [Lactobacillus selangorensis]
MNWSLVATIFILNAAYIAINTLRTMMVVKHHHLLAPLLSVFEEIVYVVGLSMVLKNLDNIVNLMAYSFGFAFGIYLGMLIEEKLALGYTNFNVTVPVTPEGEDDHGKKLPQALRDKGYGVTETWGYGKDGPRMILSVLAPRNADKDLINLIQSITPNAFIVSYEPTSFHGGFLSQQVDKHFKRREAIKRKVLRK